MPRTQDLDATAAQNADLKAERSMPGDDYALEVIAKHLFPVSQETFLAKLEANLQAIESSAAKLQPFRKMYPNLMDAFRRSGMTKAQLATRANEEFYPNSKPTKDDLIQALLMTAAKRHTTNITNFDIDALEKLITKAALGEILENEEACKEEWSAMVDLYVDAQDALSSPDTNEKLSSGGVSADLDERDQKNLGGLFEFADGRYPCKANLVKDIVEFAAEKGVTSVEGNERHKEPWITAIMEALKLSELKDWAGQLDIVPTGNKTKRDSWKEAILESFSWGSHKKSSKNDNGVASGSC